MENRKRPFVMVSCKKHTDHQQSPGVCSLCLRERLIKISGSSSSHAHVSNVSSSSSSSSISSVSSVSSSRASSNVPSNTASPMHKSQTRTKIYDVEGKGYLSFLRKSRSVAFVSEKSVQNDGRKKKGDGFWSKLMGLKRSDVKKRLTEDGSSRLMHSRTMREMLTTRV
ncbi:hypothetical protein CTI12_AA272860 [Artemisia annua]|uniref:Uncharacterized protein n=1 Tax=Artemisia annua TaxID=35608 RepID=A0A2U1NFE2_ARTAN|nr:hypothetical protein CTI12_AA272860 [Artemisia annua]